MAIDREPPQLRVVAPSAPDVVFADEMGKPLGPIPWVCSALRIAPGRPTSIVGLAGSRKTFLALDLEIAVASSTRVLGFDVRAGRALHVDLEATRRPTFERLQALARGRGFELASLGDRLAYVWQPLTSWRKSSSLDRFCSLIEPYDLVVVDPVRGALDGADENSSAASAPLELAIAASAKTGSAIAFIDHGQGRPRGHSSKLDASQVLIACAAASRIAPTFVTCPRDQVAGLGFADFSFTHIVEDDRIRLIRDSEPVRIPTGGLRTGLETVVSPEALERAKRVVLDVLSHHHTLTSGNAVAKLAVGAGGKQPVLAALRALRATGEVVVEDGCLTLAREVQP
jgi:hypothetical protein